MHLNVEIVKMSLEGQNFYGQMKWRFKILKRICTIGVGLHQPRDSYEYTCI